MTIIQNAGPANGRDVVRQALAIRMPQGRSFSTPLGGAPQAGSPVPFYHLPLSKLDSQDPLSQATLSGWRYPVVGGINPGLADLREGSDDSSPMYAGLVHGGMVQRFMQAALLAEQTLGSTSDAFEPRILDVPALQFSALWLVGKTTNYFISLLEGRPPGSAPLAVVSDIVPSLIAKAGARHAAASSPFGGSSVGGSPTN
jgi:hypothetical protein